MMSNNSQILSSIGEAIYGPQWVSAMAQQLHVSDRSMRRWANGTDPMPYGLWLALYKLVTSRANNLLEWRQLLWDRVLEVVGEPPIENFNPNTDWWFEVHDPQSGQLSKISNKILRNVADVKAEMKLNPGMVFRVQVPRDATQEDWDEFRKLNIQRM
jgi:hypothetical protein